MKELKYITLAQIIGCLLVIWGHSYPFVSPMPEVVVESRLFIYMFHMPLFVFCSGFLFAYTKQSQRKRIGEYISQRAQKLLVPYFVFSLIGLLPKYFAQSVLNDSLSIDAMSLARVFLVPRDNIWGHFWFLPMIFFLGCISFLLDGYLLSKWDKRIKWAVVSILLIVLKLLFIPTSNLQWFGINDVISFAWCYALGMFVSYAFGDLKKKVHLSRPQAVGILILGGGTSLVISRLVMADLISGVMVAVIMTASILILCVAFNGSITINKQSLIAQTYQLFILSWPCQIVMEILTERILHLNWMIIIPIVFAVGVLGPMLLLKLINWFEIRTKTKFISYILGR